LFQQVWPGGGHITDITQESLRTMGNLGSKLTLLGDIWAFLKVRKKWWLAPIIFFLLIMAALIVFTEGSALAPFIYAIF
jgi:hypothetical protein